MSKYLLGVNIDHIATIRNVRGTNYPDLVKTIFICKQAGADLITVHLREDRRHIQDRDVYMIRSIMDIPMNLEIAITDEMINIACKIKPHFVCLVPENRNELTTERGLDICKQTEKIHTAINILKQSGISVSLFVDPDCNQIQSAIDIGAQCIEINTGTYSDLTDKTAVNVELSRIHQAVNFASNFKLVVNAGHGLNYQNIKSIAAITDIYEFNIGHAIISRSLFTGLDIAIKEMKHLIKEARI